MSVEIVILYHSHTGHTKLLAEHVTQGASSVEGATARLVSVDDVAGRLGELTSADAIVFGCPTYMGSASAAFKAFMDSTARVWAAQTWRDKLAAGFTHSAAPSGDKMGTLLQLATFAAQHGMVWVSLGLPPTYASAGPDESGLNRLGSHLGAMAQSVPGAAAQDAPPEGDRKTAEHLGRRVAEWAVRAQRGLPQAERVPTVERHPCTATWVFPPAGRGDSSLPRVNVRELAARPGRMEHHLMVVATIGKAQLELATASEPLYFAHANVSDEYAIALPTGDSMIDSFPMRTFLSDKDSNEDVARIRHRTEDVVLHPYGLLHWPGRLRPPYEPFPFPPGTRRAGLILVLCASELSVPERRPVSMSKGRALDFKVLREDVPAHLVDLHRESGRVVGMVAGATLELVKAPVEVAPARGGYVLVLECEEGAGASAPGDLVFVPAGSSVRFDGVTRALVFSSKTEDASLPPASWRETPPLPFPPFEDAEPGALPLALGPFRFEAVSDAIVAVRSGDVTREVPRYWLARMLFRVALHGYRMGYVETYGGLWIDEIRGQLALGLRGGADTVIAYGDIERLYRAVAPSGYTERLE